MKRGFDTYIGTAKRFLFGPTFPPLALAAAFLVLYGYSEFAGSSIYPEKASVLSTLSPLVWILVILFFVIGVGSSFQQLKERAERATSSGEIDRLAFLGEPFLTSRRRHGFLAIFGAYLVAFSWASTVLIIRPGQDFTAAYGVQVPSARTVVCCGPVGTVPSYAVYLLQGLGLLLIPANVLLALSVSLLAALSLSVSLAAFAMWHAASRGAGSAGLAGFVGFIATCPSCAGQALLGAILGPGSAALALAFSPWQLYLALTSVGLLLVTLWAQTHWLAKARQSCGMGLMPGDAARLG